jgi:hypothetical protein
MAWLNDVTMQPGAVSVVTTSDGGHSPEFFAERIVARLITISENTPEPLKAQALVFRDSLHALILDGIKRAIASDRAYFQMRNT